METFRWAGWRDEAKKKWWEAGWTKPMLDSLYSPSNAVLLIEFIHIHRTPSFRDLSSCVYSVAMVSFS